ncbi:hypothetical protein METHB2_10040 [Candidatus Methylobacter favarea]|uniref:Uncharacterized protein n=1 Tax=Candidatus Methylobacter favarea TaxID=2707345 RepID=A0A8S0WLF3_9GAMM|nr:hypothetical protein [Candidatus Methylobacter favarea]CAA9889010.1 hypothetical protein METHB2_10040 [Candidatus Methylobacter favarea]
MKLLPLCLTFLFSTLAPNRIVALPLPDTHDVKQARFLPTTADQMKNSIIIASLLATKNSSGSASTGTGSGEGLPESAGNSERIGAGTGSSIVKRFHESKRLGVGTGGGYLETGYKTERLGVGTGSKPKPSSKGNSDENY